MIEKINDQQIELANCIWEYDLSHEIDLGFSLPKFEINLCDDGVSFFTLEFGLEKYLTLSWLLYHPYLAPLRTTLRFS